MTHTRMCQECPVSLEKLSFFFIQVKIIQVLVFDNWHPLNGPIKFCTNLMHVLIYWKLTCNEFNKTSRTQLMLCDSVDRLMEGDF